MLLSIYVCIYVRRREAEPEQVHHPPKRKDYTAAAVDAFRIPAAFQCFISTEMLSITDKIEAALLLKMRLFLSFHSCHQVSRAKDRHNSTLEAGVREVFLCSPSCDLVLAVQRNRRGTVVCACTKVLAVCAQHRE